MHKGKKITEIGFEVNDNGDLIYKIVGKKNLSKGQLDAVDQYFNTIKNDTGFLKELKERASGFLDSGAFKGKNREAKLKALINNL